MKKTIVSTITALALVVLGSASASAAPGGMPGAHGVDGKTFGKLVSGLATSGPGAVASHVSGR